MSTLRTFILLAGMTALFIGVGFMIGGEQKSEIIDLDQVEDDEEQEENNNNNGGLFEFDLPLD